MARVSEVRWSPGKKDWGDFRVQRFNLFSDEGTEAYAELRTRASDSSNGIVIESIKEYSRKTVLRSRDEDTKEGTTTTVEEIFMVVHYWEKTPTRTRGTSNDDIEATREFARIGSVG